MANELTRGVQDRPVRMFADGRAKQPPSHLPAVLADSTFEAVILGWDGAAARGPPADGSGLRERVEALCAAGVHVFVVSDGEVDGWLAARPPGPGQLHLCVSRGSDVYAVTADGSSRIWRRTTAAEEEQALDRAAELTVKQLLARGVEASVVSQPPTCRTIALVAAPMETDLSAESRPEAGIGRRVAAAIQRLHRAGLRSPAEVIAIAADAARTAGLADARITCDLTHVDIGLTGMSDSARWAAAWLAEQGITGGLILVGGYDFGAVSGVGGHHAGLLVPELARAPVVSVGIEPAGRPRRVLHVRGGPARLVEIFDVQLTRRRDRRVPSIDPDPAWVLRLPGGPTMQRVAEALGALTNGWAGSRAALEEGGPTSSPLFAVNGVYTAGPMPELLAGPRWDTLAIAPAADDGDGDDKGEDHRPDGHADQRVTEPVDVADATAASGTEAVEAGDGLDERQVVDLRTGVLLRRDRFGLRTLRFLSAARPEAMALRAEAAARRLGDRARLAAPGGNAEFERRRRRGAELARVSAPGDGGIAVAARDRTQVTGGRRTVERLAAWAADRTRAPAWPEMLDRLAELQSVGFDGLLAEHRTAWARRWAEAEVCIEGDPNDELAARFAVFHLLGAASETDEAAVGPRGLTGGAYGGHVFWDAEAFVLPALAAIRPAAARAVLEYRIRRLPAAHSAATRRGLRGARFPWESAGDGTDVTPTQTTGRGGEAIPILTDDYEEHIVADVAWAACRYAAWTGDTAFLTGSGRPLLVDTARYWASRIRRDPGGGRAHLEGVMGPDEYHPTVDDNAYTNAMARWNLRRAAQLVEDAEGATAETRAWRTLADALVDGYDPERGLHEQFTGYWKLEPLLAAEVAPPPVAADLLLGTERVAGSQLIKQADVIMAHHLVPEEMTPGSLAADLAHYGPRTVHGSSLSPAIYAAQLARVGQPDDALALFRLAARLDLDDITGTTANGLHLATFGGVWQALAHGFLGLSPSGPGLAIDPHLPAGWDAVTLRFRFQGHPVGVRAERDGVTVSCTHPLDAQIVAGPLQRCEPPGRTFTLDRSPT